METKLITGKFYRISARTTGMFAGLCGRGDNTAKFVVASPHAYLERDGYVCFFAETANSFECVNPEPEGLHETQKARILEYLKTGKSITKLEALRMFGCWNGGDVIFKLRRDGYNIETTMINYGKKCFASYKLIENV